MSPRLFLQEGTTPFLIEAASLWATGQEEQAVPVALPGSLRTVAMVWS